MDEQFDAIILRRNKVSWWYIFAELLTKIANSSFLEQNYEILWTKLGRSMVFRGEEVISELSLASDRSLWKVGHLFWLWRSFLKSQKIISKFQESGAQLAVKSGKLSGISKPNGNIT